jgi:hypothetical protein
VGEEEPPAGGVKGWRAARDGAVEACRGARERSGVDTLAARGQAGLAAGDADEAAEAPVSGQERPLCRRQGLGRTQGRCRRRNRTFGPHAVQCGITLLPTSVNMRMLCLEGTWAT